MSGDPTGTASARFAVWLLAHRRWVLALATLMALLGGVRTVLTYKNLRSDLEELLPESAPSVHALDVLRSRLPGLRHLGVVLDTGGPEHVSAANAFVDKLAERARGYPPELVGAVRTHVKRERKFAETYLFQLMEPGDIKKLREAVERRRDWQVTRAMGMDLLDEDEAPAPELPIEELRKKYEARHGKPQALPDDRFVADDGNTVVLLIQASSNATSYEDDARLLSKVKADIAELGLPEGMRVGYAGDVATRVEEMEGLVVDLGISGAMVLLLVIGVIILYFRTLRSLAVLTIPLMVGTVCAFGLAALPPFSIRHLNSNTAFLGSIVVGNGINSGIILLARFVEERRSHELREAIIRAVSGTWRPTLAAAAAAAIAYGSLVFTDFRGFNQFGWIGGFGMLVCWLATFLIAPPLILFFYRTAPPATARQKRSPERSPLAKLLRHPRTVLAVTSLLCVAAVVGLAKRRTDWLEHDFSKLRRRDSWVSGERYWGARMDKTLRRYLTPTVVMTASPEQAAQVAARLLELRDRQGAGGLIASVRTAGDILPSTRADAAKEAKKLRDTLTPKLESELSERDRALVKNALTDEALTPLSASDIPDVLVAGLREHDGRIDRNVLVFPKLSTGTWDAQRMAEYTRDLRQAANFDASQAPVAGSLLLSADITSAMKTDGPRATALSLAAVLGICVLAFRSLGLSFAAVASLFAGVLLMLGSLAWTGERLNFSNFVALPITFGIAADYSINMLKRYQADGRFDLSAALSSTGGAVALCSATTIIGFGSLLVAQNRALFSFGLFAVAGELACLGTAIIALPAALALSSARAKATQRAQSDD